MICRHLQPLLVEALGQFPVVAILGSRQVGKSTLAQGIVSKAWPARYLTLDDRAILDAALRDPDGFIRGLDLPVVLDEVQRAPALLRAVKLVVDQDRKPGMFLLTGSANLLTLKSVSESLAGRIALFELHPFSWAELRRRPEPSPMLDALFEARTTKDVIAVLPKAGEAATKAELAACILGGGYPIPALMKPGRPRRVWFESYRQTYLERYLRDIATVARLPEFGHLLTAAAARTGQLLNVA